MATNSEAIRVIVRCRPFSKREEREGFRKCVKIDTASASITIDSSDNNKKGKFNESSNGKDSRKFTFDGAFDENTSQHTIYLASAKLLVESVLQGWNATILAYGQTGTGTICC